ncbi:MAG TPA: hypothetical protein PLZ44_00105 [Methanothrix sp.]|nr:hypothetical protein [Methanothrix sp.]
MAEVLEQIMGPQKQRQLVQRSVKAPWVNPKVLELQTAMEILAEVFSITISEVEVMLQERSRPEVRSCKGEYGPWPESFSLVD